MRTGAISGSRSRWQLDQVVLHELLQWHNLYVHTTEFWRTAIDGIFHLVMAGLLLLGAMRLWRGRHAARSPGQGRSLTARIILGMGGFNLYDGTVQHKVLHYIQSVRESKTACRMT